MQRPHMHANDVRDGFRSYVQHGGKATQAHRASPAHRLSAHRSTSRNFPKSADGWLLRGTLSVMATGDPELTAEVELRAASDELQVYEAIVVATSDAHGTLDVMLGASNPDAARRALQQRYGFNEVQAVAVMDLQLRRVTAIDREKIDQRRDELAARVTVLEAELRRILSTAASFGPMGKSR